DGLRGDDAHRLADLDELARRQAAAVAGAADAVLRVAAERGADADPLGARARDRLRELEVDRVPALGEDLALGVLDLLRDEPAEETIGEGLDHPGLVRADEDSVLVATVFQAD